MAEAPTCNKRMPDNVFRCDETAGHKTHHCARDGEGKIVASWPNAKTEMRRAVARGRRPRQESHQHEVAEAFTDGVKAERILSQLLVYGQARCLRCKVELSSAIDIPMDTSSVAVRTSIARCLEEAMANSAKHHTDRRRGHGYRPGKHGNDFGHDFPLLIEAPVCHDCHTGADSELHPGPAFGEGAA